MGIEELKNFSSIVLDYSVLREFGGTAVFQKLLEYISQELPEVYVGKSFKLLHYCVLHQSDDKDAGTVSAMKDLCAVLLPNKKLHEVQLTKSESFAAEISKLENSCIVTTGTGIFTKRLVEQKIKCSCSILILDLENPVFYNSVDEMIAGYVPREISKLALKKEYLNLPFFCNVGDVVTTGNQEKITLESRISAGAEGMVFATDKPQIVAKIYHNGMITPLRWSKLSKMVSIGIKSVGICWPQDLLFFRGVPVGYTMLLGKGRTLGNVFDGPDAMVSNFPDWKREDVVETLLQLLEKYLYLHMHDIVAGDIQLKNALLYSSSNVYLIDMDSIQIGNLPCPVGTEEFAPPFLWGTDFSTFLRKLYDEDYCISMMVFSVLFCGLHPYATRLGAETLKEEIEQKNFPYSLDFSDEEHIPKGGYNFIWQYLPENIREMLYNVFKLGKNVEAIEWYEAVLEYRDKLIGKNFEDEENYKIFPKMDYHKAEEAISKQSFKPTYNKFAINTEFTGSRSFKDAVIEPAPISSQTSEPVKPAVSPKPSSAYVPRGEGSHPVDNTKSESNENNGKKGLFGKLFGKG